jgi:hypothetical protein
LWPPDQEVGARTNAQGQFVDEWSNFCDRLGATLKAAGSDIIADAESVLDRDEGLRMLLRQLRYSADREIEERDPDFPVFAPTSTATYHTLADAPDYANYDAHVDGRRSYRLHGWLGAADDLNFTTLAPGGQSSAGPGDAPTDGSIPDWDPWSAPGERRGRKVTGMLGREDLQPDANGHFEVLVSSWRPDDEVWLPMAPDTDRVGVRNIYHRPYRAHRRRGPAELFLAPVGQDSLPRPYGTDDLRAGLAGLLDALDRVPLARAGILRRIQKSGVGVFADGDHFWKSVGSNPRTRFYEAYWRLGAQEAMIVEVEPTLPGSFWSLGVTNFWLESLDFRYFPVNLNSHSVTYDANGGVRVVLAHEDPGVSNWLSTAGHAQGCLLWRWDDVGQTPPFPRVRVVDHPREGLPGSVTRR